MRSLTFPSTFNLAWALKVIGIWAQSQDEARRNSMRRRRHRTETGSGAASGQVLACHGGRPNMQTRRPVLPAIAPGLSGYGKKAGVGHADSWSIRRPAT